MACLMEESSKSGADIIACLWSRLSTFVILLMGPNFGYPSYQSSLMLLPQWLDT
jgi:hypothetical protein